MTARLTYDQLTAAVTNLVENQSPHVVGITALSSAFREFLVPLTHEGLRDADVARILVLGEDWMECMAESSSPFAAMEENTGAYRRHTAKAYQKLRVACMAVCEGGTP